MTIVNLNALLTSCTKNNFYHCVKWLVTDHFLHTYFGRKSFIAIAIPNLSETIPNLSNI